MATDPYKYFRIEGRELTDGLSQAALALEKAAAPAPHISKLLRLAHTLKGAARVVKQNAIADLSHRIEDMLGPYRENATHVPKEQITTLLKLVDEIDAQLRTLGQAPLPPASSAGTSAPPPASQPAAAPPKPGVAAEEPLRVVRAEVDEVDALLEGVGEVSVQLAAIRKAGRSLDQVVHLVELIVSQLTSPATVKARALSESLKSQLLVLQRALASGVEHGDRELRGVRESTERLRLMPARLMFGALERAARDSALGLGKQVTFEARGGSVTLDADVLTSMQGALVQAIRNAIAHGIELPVARAHKGKAPSGTVIVEVIQTGNRVSFTCADDGAGLDLNEVRRVAQAKGRTLTTDAEALEALFAGGLSTTQDVTEHSGRGIGLDVVRETAARLGGTAVLRPRVPGPGTVLHLDVPVSLSSVDVLMVESEGQQLAVPLAAVKHVLEVPKAHVTHTNAGDTVMLGHDLVHYATLATCRGHFDQPYARHGVLLQVGDERVVIGVDRIIGTQNVVQRPVPELIAEPAVAGALLDVDGTPQLILEPSGLVKSVLRARARQLPKAAPPKPILVIDDSLTTRMLEQSILESAGYRVEVAQNAEEGYEKALHTEYALILVDVEMPGMDGFTFVEKSRADPRLQHVPAILVTSRNEPADRERGKAVGASAYIVKTEFEQTELLERIRRLVRP